MQTNLADFIKNTPDGDEAEAILRACVHCGFCTATCPTYQLLGDELDGPRGRIYLIKQVLEGQAPTAKTQLHLDRCLTCRNCETTCPSGVQYGRLLDIGRKVVDDMVPRPLGQRLLRGALREALPRQWLFTPAMKTGQLFRPLLPKGLRNKVPAAQPAGVLPTRVHARKMLLLDGCVQPAMAPNINAATARVLDALGVQLVIAPRAGCCGAIRHHLNDHDGALHDARANIDAWWPLLEAGAEAIVMTASGCGSMVKEYGHLLRDDPAYAAKAGRVAAMTKDLSEILPAFEAELAGKLKGRIGQRVAYHPPCTLQHGQQIRGKVESVLRAVGVDVQLCADSHLCCGSAGTYSVTQPVLSFQLRDNKLANLQATRPDQIVSANIGCLTHLQSGTETPVRHWIELIDSALAGTA
ncbi:glycolate oxidase iron-sulfur subunit [Actimicrobium sp. GrIS 1.19]|uniref:glycolate oxidase subunit GlcF n=1 Tax=Actimicrobium sp. GrIS 1.19 TaxID=3071708 RepID=UPI002E08D98C|nr:glycolate oxidase iron-sulfur subunit [Actimicrobium sp. GrIS 1.19]